MMRVRLRVLLTSFNKAVMEYALARLEFASEHPDVPSPPVLDRLGSYLRLSDELTAKWPASMRQVREAAAFIASVNGGALRVKPDLAWGRLVRAVKTVEQFAQSIEWIGLDPKAGAAGDDGA